MDKSILQLIFQLSVRSLWSHRLKNLVVGTIIFIGVFLLVVANAMLDSVGRGMESSITASITGHLQLYDKNAQDRLSMMGMLGNFLSTPNIGHIADFETLRKAIEKIPNVKAVVPMGTDTAIVYSGNLIDQATSALRQALKQLDPSMTRQQKEQALQPHIQSINDLLAHLQREYQLILAFSANQDKTREALAYLAQAQQATFWPSLLDDPESGLQFLENRIAPLMEDDNPVFMELLGTDLDRFAASFPRFKIVKGSQVPSGQRGLLVNDVQYEKIIKDRIARVFDRIAEKRSDNEFIKDDKELQQYIQDRAKEYKQWLLSFDSKARLDIKTALREFLNKPTADLDVLIPEFLALTDENFSARYDFFYQKIAPKLKLYPINIGDTITLRKFGNGESQKVIFYGTYQFTGVEKSGFSAIFNLVDIMTFRDLYGFMSEEKQLEVKKLKQEFSTEALGRDAVEDALFETDDTLISNQNIGSHTAAEPSVEPPKLSQDEITQRFNRQVKRHYSQAEIDQGSVLSAAVVLKDVDQLKQTQRDIEKLIVDQDLPLQTIDWQTAAGYVGQMIAVMKIVLVIFIVFVFLVSMVVVNNAMLMSTMNRYGEIGTLRAIGAGREVIMGIFLLESAMLTLVAALIGATVGILTIKYFHLVGIAAPRFEFYFLFGGPRLFPDIHFKELYLGPVVILIVSILATFYPALLATRVPPMIAMSARE